jgi:MFS transporter, BCD family, chlorophyll transporter
MNDTVGALASRGMFGPALAVPKTGYVFVYGVEIVMLAATVFLMAALAGRGRKRPPA